LNITYGSGGISTNESLNLTDNNITVIPINETINETLNLTETNLTLLLSVEYSLFWYSVCKFLFKIHSKWVVGMIKTENRALLSTKHL
jgi:hypothetical protein